MTVGSEEMLSWPDIVPLPDARGPDFHSTFPNSSDQQAARQRLAWVNQGLKNSSDNSHLAQRTKAELKNLLRPEDTME